MSFAALYKQKRLTMWLDLSTYCNAGCPQCHRTDPDGLGKVDWIDLVQWSIDDFIKLFSVETMSRVKTFDICGTWGDPMMNKDIFKICEYIIKNSSASIEINTNGGMRNDEWWWDLAAMCKNRLNVIFTVDGSTQEIHSLYRQKTDLGVILSNMHTLSMGGATASVYTVIFKHNQHDLVNIVNLARAHGARDIVFVVSNRFGDNPRFNFIKDGQQQYLQQTDLPTEIQSKINQKGFVLNSKVSMKMFEDAFNV